MHLDQKSVAALNVSETSSMFESLFVKVDYLSVITLQDPAKLFSDLQ